MATHMHVHPCSCMFVFSSLHNQFLPYISPSVTVYCEDLATYVCPRGSQLTGVLLLRDGLHLHRRCLGANKMKGYHILTKNIDELPSAYDLHKSQSFKINNTMPYVQLKWNKKNPTNNNPVCKVSTPRKVVGKNGELFFFNGQYHMNLKEGTGVKGNGFTIIDWPQQQEQNVASDSFCQT